MSSQRSVRPNDIEGQREEVWVADSLFEIPATYFLPTPLTSAGRPTLCPKADCGGIRIGRS